MSFKIGVAVEALATVKDSHRKVFARALVLLPDRDSGWTHGIGDLSVPIAEGGALASLDAGKLMALLLLSS